MNCFQLEINECDSDEYQCHNGMCVPEEFFRDGLFDSECLDSADENYYISDNKNKGFIHCYKDPSFRCEDAFHPHRDLDFACGDGQQSSLRIFATLYTSFTGRSHCSNGRDLMLRYLLHSDAEQANLTYECWVLMNCLTYRLVRT